MSNDFCKNTRREFLWETGAGFTGLALTGLLAGDGFFAKQAFANPPVPHGGESEALRGNVLLA